MSVSQSEVNDFMETVVQPEEQPQVEQVVPTVPDAPVQETAPVQEIPLAPVEGTPVESAPTPEPVAGGKTPEQVEIERLRAEVNRLSVDHEVVNFETNLRQTTEIYLKNKNESIDKAHQRNRELIDAGEPEKADAELRDFYTRLQAADDNMRGYVQAQRTQFTQKREHVEMAPKYAQHLGKLHGLAPEDVALLSKFDGFAQDKMVPDMIARNKAANADKARLRDLEASVRAQSGAFAPAGSSGGAIPAVNQRPSDPMEAELWDYMQSPTISIGGQ